MGFLSILRSCSLPIQFPSPKAYRSKKCAAYRIKKELKRSRKDPPTHISYGLVSVDDLFHMQGIIVGPCDTPFEGGLFFLSIELPYNYPLRPPKISFQTKVFHPYVDQNGKIHIDILGKMWSPALTIEKLLLSICSVLPDPSQQKKSHFKKAREWTIKYAMS